MSHATDRLYDEGIDAQSPSRNENPTRRNPSDSKFRTPPRTAPEPYFESSAVRYGILSTFPPTRCGIATFTAALARSLARQGISISVVRIRDTSETEFINDSIVVAELTSGDSSSRARAVSALNNCDLAIVQHEYGLFGGTDGDEIVSLVDQLEVPTVAILHTVLAEPTTHQREVLNELGEKVDRIVVMTAGARQILRDVFKIDDTKVEIIAHGASIARPRRGALHSVRPIILTWGLLGPGKGIEWVIDSLAQLKDLSPRPLYVVAGQTHPKVLAHEGDVYRNSLLQRVIDKDVSDLVAFDNSYRNLDSLGRLIGSAAVVVLPYDSNDQATSGVLVDAIAAGRPVIATPFPHARELLATGAGITVQHRDPHSIALALRRVLSEPAVARSLEVEANRLSESLSWDHVASQYLEIGASLAQSVSAGAA
jgi:glycosyltransferase involved in cell wall biosynthesis